MRAVYVHEIKDAERSAKRRAKMEARYGSILASAQGANETTVEKGAEVVELRQRGR